MYLVLVVEVIRNLNGETLILRQTELNVQTAEKYLMKFHGRKTGYMENGLLKILNW